MRGWVNDVIVFNPDTPPRTVQIMTAPLPPLPEGYSPQLRHTLGCCLGRDARARPTAAQFLASPTVQPDVM